MKLRYRIYQLSARSIISYAEDESNGKYIFKLNSLATEKSKAPGASHEQEDNALFYQIMCELYGNNFKTDAEANLITDLSDVICYIDFAGIFDRACEQKKYSDRQAKAKNMFRPQGITLDFGTGSHTYVAFERSASMSRNARLSFIRADLYDRVRARIMLDMVIGKCQLSKLYAYNGLMLSSGTRIDDVEIDKPHRVIVVENNKLKASANVITVEDDGTDASVRKYTRVERYEQFIVTEYDGVGLISKEYAAVIDKKFCGKSIHSSFQIRMPYVKGMIHKVDFRELLSKSGYEYITDIWGDKHSVNDVDIILTESMFKGAGWLRDSGMTWQDYWKAFKKYNHGLYITNVNKIHPEKFTELNYQFLNTLSVTADEFRPLDLPFGWELSPEEDNRNWLTKQTELEYYNLCANEEYRRQYFLKEKKRFFWNKKTKSSYLADILEANPLFINESIYADELSNRADSILKSYALGTLIVSGDMRYLSADLLRFISIMPLVRKPKTTSSENAFFQGLMTDHYPQQSFYAPQAVYDADKVCTLLRNPHIARNEELQLNILSEIKNMRKSYLGHLCDVVMVDSEMYAAERLGGADYDGDMVRTISDPIVNKCVQRNYERDGSLDNRDNMPFLKIPDAEPKICDANDWEARFETIKNTFSSRVGQISNAAFDRSVIAYNENSDSEERKKCREETETLAILTGLEIDSAKSGIKPDLSEYLGKSKRQRSIFLEYKNKFEKYDEKVKGAKEKLDKFFEKINWDEVDSNVERLPYLSKMLKENTPRIKAKYIEDNMLFSFTVSESWKDSLDKNILKEMKLLISEYELCLDRIRKCRTTFDSTIRKSDIDRILYCQGKDEDFDSDILYAVFTDYSQEHLKNLFGAIKAEKWHYMNSEDRISFLYQWIPEMNEYFDILSDFRHGGFRILGDLVMDFIHDFDEREKRKLRRDNDSEFITSLIDAYENKLTGESYRQAVSKKCREILEGIIKPREAIKYAVALGKRNFMWDVLLDEVPNVVLKQRRESL